MSTVVLTYLFCHIYGYISKSGKEHSQKRKTRALRSGLLIGREDEVTCCRRWALPPEQSELARPLNSSC